MATTSWLLATFDPAGEVSFAGITDRCISSLT
jgi:hypothetical protein